LEGWRGVGVFDFGKPGLRGKKQLIEEKEKEDSLKEIVIVKAI